MIKTIIYLFFLLSISLNLAAQTKAKSLLWEISGKKLPSQSYLFGTIHTIQKKDFFFDSYMEACFNKCEMLVTEIPLEIPMSAQLKMANRTFIPNKKSIQDYITPKQYQQLYSYLLDTLRFNDSKIKRLTKFKPLFLQAYINLKQIKRHIEYETKLFKMAKKNKLEFESLESVAYQMDIIDKIPIEAQISSLFVDGKNFYGASIKKEFMEMVALYKSQDIQAIYDLMDTDEEFTSYKTLLLTNRNLNWIPKIEILIQKKPTFIAVGAGHLAGEKGVIQLLINSGYTVRPITN